MILEQGKYYYTEKGEIVGPLHKSENHFSYHGSEGIYESDGTPYFKCDPILVAEAVGSPIRAKTYYEIVPGVYNKIKVYDEQYVKGHVCLGMPISYHWNAPELRAAIDVLTEIAQALENEPN